MKQGIGNFRKYPFNDDIRTVFMGQILQDKVLEDWDLTSNAQHMKYILYNSADIEKKFLPESTNMDFFHSKRSK